MSVYVDRVQKKEPALQSYVNKFNKFKRILLLWHTFS